MFGYLSIALVNNQGWLISYATFSERKEVKKDNCFEEKASTDYYGLWLSRHGVSQQQKLAYVMPIFFWPKTVEKHSFFE